MVLVYYIMLTKIAGGIIFCLSACCGTVLAQPVAAPDSTQKAIKSSTYKPVIQPVKKPKPITKELSAGLRLNTDGWSFIIERGRYKTSEPKKIDMFHDVRVMQFEFTEHRHPKELKVYAADGRSTKTYVYGKINNFYSVRLNIGNRKMIAGKPYPKSISVHWVYAGGLSIGLLKPYYLETADLGTIKYTPETSHSFLNTAAAIGSAGFAKGIGETKIIPGIDVKTGLHFDFSQNKFLVAAVEVGIAGEYYSQDIEMMALQKATPYLFNFYAGIQFGKRRR